jgi:diguanylate cyclase (GGDEF)-like protein
VLVQCAQRLRGVARAHDHLVRWGGEEFVLLLRSGSRHDAPAVAQRLLQAVAGQAFELPGGQALPLTCSVGWCAFPPDPGAPGPARWHEALQRADAHLFEAKRAGRNRAVG